MITTIGNRPVKITAMGMGYTCPLCSKAGTLEIIWLEPIISNIGFTMHLKKVVPIVACRACNIDLNKKSLTSAIKTFLREDKKSVPIPFLLKPGIFFILLVIFLGGIFVYFKLIRA